jgi:flagellar basal-body rod protein FlgG
MLDSLYIAATGLTAQQANVDAISNNLANVNTTAFKRDRVAFEDLLYRELAKANPLLDEGRPFGSIGAGVGIANGSKIFVQGDVKKTDLPFDVAIRGRGFFEITMPDGTRAYSRAGSFQLDKSGLLGTPQGYPLRPSIQVPQDAASVTIEPTGTVLAKLPDQNDPIEVGRIELTDFVNPSGLTPIGDNLFVPSARSGDALTRRPGDEGAGTLGQGFLEGSNVKLAEEFINLVIAQRAYEANAKAIQVADEMLSITNNLRR